MILSEELRPIGRFTRPHGVQGEISLQLTDDVFDCEGVSCFVCLIDGIYVPFFIDEYRYKTDNVVLVKLDRVTTVEQARRLSNRDVFVLRRECDECLVHNRSSRRFGVLHSCSGSLY